MIRNGNYCEEFFQFRHFQVVKNSFCLSLSAFLTGKKLLLNCFRGLHLLNPEKSCKHFQNRAPCWTPKRTQLSFPWRHRCVYWQRPITARVALTTLNKLLSNTTLDQSAREKSLGCYNMTDRQLILLKLTWHPKISDWWHRDRRRKPLEYPSVIAC